MAIFRFSSTGSAKNSLETRSTSRIGCRSWPLGTARYACVAAPRVREALVARKGALSGLEKVPILTYDPADRLHAQLLGGLSVHDEGVGAHVIPNHRVFYALLLAGAGLGLVPLQEAEPHLETGALVELLPGKYVDVALYWHAWELQTPLMQGLTDAIVSGARAYFSSSRSADGRSGSIHPVRRRA